MIELEKKQAYDKRYNSIDIWKLVMAIAVVAIHTKPLIALKNTVVLSLFDQFINLSVPFFFLASGYLLASKMDSPYGSERNIDRVKKQWRSILRMYLIWSLIYAPIAVYQFVITERPVTEAILLYIRGFVLLGEQYNSWQLWYLLSTIYTLPLIIFALKRKRARQTLVLISVAASVIQVVLTILVKYQGEMPSFIAKVRTLVEYSIAGGRLFSGMIYIPVGIILAKRRIPKYINWACLVVGFTLDFLIEDTLLSSYLVILSAIALFGIIESVSVKNNPIYRILRQISTVTYLLHMYIWTIYYTIVYGEKTYGVDSFVVTVLIAILVAIGYIFIKEKMGKRYPK